MTSIKDVARRASVSTSTVSHVLNNSRYVSPALRARVLEAIDALGYQPNLLARGLRSKATKTFGMIVPDNSNPFFAEIARSIEDACFSLGYNVILCNSGSDPEREQAHIGVLLDKQVDGILFVTSSSRPEHLRPVLDRQTPLVIIDRELEGALQADCVVVNNRKGGYQATEHLIKRGHRRIGCIAGPSELTPSWERVHGFNSALGAHGLEPDPELLCRGDFRAEGGYRAMLDLLSLPQPPSAVFACNDLMALGALRAARELGLRVPDDIALVGFDDIALASYVHPPLSTVAQPLRELGRLAAEILVGRVAGNTDQPKRLELEARLIVRGSS